MQRNFSRRSALLLAFTAIVITGLLYMLYSFSLSRQSFDSSLWKNAEPPNSIRLEMADDLLANHPLIGLSQPQIDALLGIPPKTAYFPEYQYVYWLGPERGFIRIDSEWLTIKFVDGTVKEARIMRD